MALKNTIQSLCSNTLANLSTKDKDTLKQAQMIGKWRVWEKIKVKDLIIPEYQRKALNLKSMIQALRHVGNIDLDFFGALNVTENEEGTYDVDNGQRRSVLLLCYLMLKAKETMTQEEFEDIEIPCLVSPYKDYKARAKSFWLFNGGGNASKSLNNEEQFHAQVEAGIADALVKRDLLVRAELACGEVNSIKSSRQIAYKTLDKAQKMGERNKRAVPTHEDRSEFWIEQIAKLFKKTWGPGQFDNQLFNGFTHLVNHPHYQELFQQDKIWDRFEAHITGLTSVYGTPKQYVETMQKYKNVADWSLGIAYGIVKHFTDQIRGKGVRAKQLKREYDAAVNGD
jgi:hypothetical protein